MGERSNKTTPGRDKPTHEPSGHGSYCCRWRKQERRETAVARQKALCESGRDVIKGTEHDPWHKKPMDWRGMVPKGELSDNSG